jgi:rare lipoprotein A
MSELRHFHTMQHTLATRARPVATVLLISLFAIVAARATAAEPSELRPPQRLAVQRQPALDRTGRPRIGIASFYAGFFAGRKMADGSRMNPQGTNAASRTLPLGTIAKVTDLSTHRSAVVRIEDRGPYVSGRIVDLSPATARKIGITSRLGLARVRVTPLAVPHSGQRERLTADNFSFRGLGDVPRYR